MSKGMILNVTERFRYYIALKYVFAMVDSDLSPEMNSAVGMQMMLTFAKMGNPYAINFLKTCFST